MSAYRRKRRRYKERYTYEERIRYWDEKILADPDKLPTNYNYNVPDVPEPEGGPQLSDFGLTESMREVIEYYRDKTAKLPSRFDSKFGKNFNELVTIALGSAIFSGLLAFAANSSHRTDRFLETSAYAVAGFGGLACIYRLLVLIGTPIMAGLAKLNFARLSPVSGPSPLLDGKTLLEAEKALEEWANAVEAQKSDYDKKCEARMTEIWRRHKLRVQRLKTNREFQRLQGEELAKAARFEYESFPTLAMNPGYWMAGSTADEKGSNLEQKFGRLLKDAGYTVKFTPKSGDDGVDIIATKDGQDIVVQCKNYVAKVGAGEIRDFAGALKFVRESSSKTIGWLVAPNGFSESTSQKFHRPGDIELWEFSDIQELVVETYHKVGDIADEELGVSEQ